MRIITGEARGMKLVTPEGLDTRPTSERAKEGIFSAIHFKVPGRRILDLFCGSGQLALEALSRGASGAVLIDNDRAAFEAAKKNAQKTGFMPVCRLLTTDYKDYLKNCKDSFGIIFLDPPYTVGLLDKIIALILERGILAPGGIIVCESMQDGVPSESLDVEFESRRQYRYGKAHITIFEKTL